MPARTRRLFFWAATAVAARRPDEYAGSDRVANAAARPVLVAVLGVSSPWRQSATVIRKIRASDAGRTASLRSQGLTARQHSGDDEKCFQEAGCAFHIGNAKYPIRSRRPSSCRRPLGLLRFLARREPLGPSTRANSPAAGSQSWSLKGDGPGRSPRAAGWLSARFGRRRFFLICTVLFTVSSFLAFKAVHRRPSRVFPSDAGRYER